MLKFTRDLRLAELMLYFHFRGLSLLCYSLVFDIYVQLSFRYPETVMNIPDSLINYSNRTNTPNHVGSNDELLYSVTSNDEYIISVQTMNYYAM